MHARNTGIYSVLASVYNTLRKGCETRQVVHVFGDHAESTGMCSVFASLHNILHTDVEQGKLSQASMPLATMPKTFVFFYSALLFLHGLRVQDSGLINSISETETQCNKEFFLSAIISWMSKYHAFPPNRTETYHFYV